VPRPAYFRGEVLAGAALVGLGLGALGLQATLQPASPVGPEALDVRPARVDVNLASRDALTVLPGVGAKTAARLVDARPFVSLEEVRAVLGDELFARVVEHITLGAPADAAAVSTH
jgi:DNA uptake protein ComE-like DNA-binding protein